MKAKDLILIALICANMALGTVALVVYSGKAESAAVAAATTSRAGDYVIATAPLSRSRDTVLVIDVVSKRAVVYVSGTLPGGVPGSTWDVASGRDLAADFHAK